MPEEFFETPQPAQPTESKPSSWPKIILAAVLGLGLLIGAAYAGYWYGAESANLKSQSSRPQPKTQSEELPTPTPASLFEPTPAPVTDPTANWKTYLSPKADYSFKYPTEWPLVNVPVFPQCTVCVEDIVFTPKYNPNTGENNLAVILVFKEDRIKTLEDYVNVHVNGDLSKINLKYTTVGGEESVSYTLSGGIPPLPVIEYAVVKNEMYYTIRLEDSTETNKNKDKNLVLFNQILSTFKFLD